MTATAANSDEPWRTTATKDLRFIYRANAGERWRIENRWGASPRGFESLSLRDLFVFRFRRHRLIAASTTGHVDWQPDWQAPIVMPSRRWHRWANEGAATARSTTGRTDAGKDRFVFREGAEGLSTPTRRDVIRRLAEAQWALGQGLPVSGGTHPLSIFFSRWLAVTRPRLRPTTTRAYTINIWRLTPFLGRIPLGALTPDMIESTTPSESKRLEVPPFMARVAGTGWQSRSQRFGPLTLRLRARIRPGRSRGRGR